MSDLEYTLRTEMRALVTWPDEAEPMLVSGQKGENADALAIRARVAGSKRNGIRTRGSATNFTVEVQHRSVTPWRTWEVT